MYNEMFSLDGKVAVVTGGNGLIGSEIARLLTQAGATVYVADTGRPSGGRGDKVRYAPVDISSEKSVNRCISAILKKDRYIDVFVNCAYPRTPDWGKTFEKIEFNSWKTNVNNHMGGYFLCARAAAEAMKKKGGSIINIASIYGVVAPDFSIYEGTAMTMPGAYAAIKSGIIGMSRYMASYYARYKIRVNAVSPGGIRDGQPLPFIKKYENKTPLGRMGTPADVAAAVLYLSADASAYVTGQNIIVDGGWTIR